MVPCNLSGTKVARFFIGLKDAPQTMQFLGTIKKLASLVPWCQNAKWQKPLTESTVTKISLNPNFLGYFNSPWKGTNKHTWFDVPNNFWEKVPAFLKIHTGMAKNKKTQEQPFPCSYVLSNWPLYFWKKSTCCSIVTPYRMSACMWREHIPISSTISHVLISITYLNM